MLSSFVFFGVMIAAIAISAIVWMALLGWGLSWAKVEYVTRSKLFIAWTGSTLIGIVANVIMLIAPFNDDEPGFAELVLFAFWFGSVVYLLMRIFDSRFLRILKALIPFFLGYVPFSVAVILFAFLFKLYFMEAYIVPTNAMAPTVLGEHCQDVCPICKQPSYFSPKRYFNHPKMICDNFHVTNVSKTRYRAKQGDRILAMKLFSLRRWDLVVFKYPGDPSENYVKRLVGLPGEMIYIADGAVWVNGQRQTLPDKIQGLEYLSEMPGIPQAWGTKDRPAVLGDDEYFMLGDFSVQSSDSRIWEKGARDRNSYAVPESHIIGVVTHTYWPLQRWRVHR